MLNRWALVFNKSFLSVEELKEIYVTQAEWIEQLYREMSSVKEELKQRENIKWDEIHSQAVESLFAHCICYQLLEKEVCDMPSLLLGQGIGRLSALVCTGFFSLQETVRILARSEMIEEKCNAVLVSGINVHMIEKYYPNQIYAICSGNKVLLKGDMETIKSMIPRWKERGIGIEEWSEKMQVLHFNTDMMDEVKKQSLVGEFCVPVLSMETGHIITSQEVSDFLSNPLLCRMNWIRLSNTLVEQKIYNVCSTGTRDDIEKILQENVKYMRIFSTSSCKEIEYMKLLCDKPEYSFSGKCLGVAVSCKNENGNTENYKKEVVEEVKKFKKYSLKMERNKEEFTLEDKKKCNAFLNAVLESKKKKNREVL